MPLLALLILALLSGPSQSLEQLPEGDKGIAAKYPGDLGIEKNLSVIWHDDFEKGTPIGRWDMVFHEPQIRMATEPENVHAGKLALEFTVPKQAAELSNSAIKKIDPPRDVIFLRYYSKFDPGFDQVGSSHNGGFLAALAPGLPYATPGIRADGKNKFMASYENWRGEAETKSPGGLNVYCYHPEQRTQWGDHFFPSGTVLPWTYMPGNFGESFVKRQDITQQLGRWYCYELMVKSNAAGKRDGRIACWLDGKLIADFPNLRLRDTDTLKINWAAIDLHIGSNTIRTNRKYYDDVVIATSYIGPRLAVR